MIEPNRKEPHCECDGRHVGNYRQVGNAMCPFCARCGLRIVLRHRTFENAIEREFCIECGQPPGSDRDALAYRDENRRLREELDTAKLYLAAVAASPSSPRPADADDELTRLRAKNRSLRRKLRAARAEGFAQGVEAACKSLEGARFEAVDSRGAQWASGVNRGLDLARKTIAEVKLRPNEARSAPERPAQPDTAPSATAEPPEPETGAGAAPHTRFAKFGAKFHGMRLWICETCRRILAVTYGIDPAAEDDSEPKKDAPPLKTIIARPNRELRAKAEHRGGLDE